MKSVHADTLFKCAFCGAECAIARLPDGEPNGIVHATPTCEKFDKNGPIEFLKLQNDATEGR